MKTFNTRESNFSNGFFTAENILENYELFTRLENRICPEDLLNLFEQIQINENLLTDEYINEYINFVYNRMFESDLFDKGFDIFKVAESNTKLNKEKPFLTAFYLLKLRDRIYREKYLKINGYETLEYYLTKNSGVVLAFYHWGLFQNFITTLLPIVNKPIVLFAVEKSVSFQLNIVESYLPKYKNLFVPLPVTFSSMKTAIKLLQTGHIVCVLPELSAISEQVRNIPQKKFLGRIIDTPLGTATMSAYSGAPLFRGILEERKRQELILDIKLISENVPISRESILTHTHKIWSELESICYKTPEQWCGWEIFDRIQGHIEIGGNRFV